VGEVWDNHILPVMFAEFINGGVGIDMAIQNAMDQIGPIFEKWRNEGLV
jgi:hypothetical protein